MASYQPHQLYQVPLAELQPDPKQPRKYLDPAALEELTASVGQMGVIQPVVCRQDAATGLLYVVAGERRCAAARKAGLAAVPALFVDGANAPQIALVENLLRQDLTPVEEGEALQRLAEEHGYPQEELARIIGKSLTTISESLSLTRLPAEIRNECRQDRSVPKHVLVEIARKKQTRSMATQFRRYRERQAREAAKAADAAAPPAARRRTKAEGWEHSLWVLRNKVDDLDFQPFSAEDREVVTQALTALKESLEAALDRAAAGAPKGS